MPIYSVKYTQHHERIITARSGVDAACEIARVARSMDGYAVECLELLGDEEGKPDLKREVGVVQEFEIRDQGDPGGPRLHRVEPPPTKPAEWYGKTARDLFPSLFGRRAS